MNRKSIFPLFVIGRKSGKTLKWRYKQQFYICRVFFDTTSYAEFWSSLPNGVLCRAMALGFHESAVDHPRTPGLMINNVERVEDQTITVEEILDNSNPSTTFLVGRKDAWQRLLVPTLERDMPFHVAFPIASRSRLSFSEALPNQKIQIVIKPYAASISLFIASSQCLIVEKSGPILIAPTPVVAAATLDRLRSRMMAHSSLSPDS